MGSRSPPHCKQPPRLTHMVSECILAVVAWYWCYRLGRAGRGVFKNQPQLWAKALGIDLSVWLAIGWVNRIHCVVWAAIAVAALRGQLKIVLVLGLLTYGMMLTDLMVSVPMYDRLARDNPGLYPKSFRRVTAQIVVIQGLYVAYAAWRVL